MKKSSSPWQPDHYDHVVYRWVKLEGKRQAWVATALGIDQSTVSRVLQRYERWRSRAKDREGGQLDHAERQRAQLWLTFERNEMILQSCLRIANELEGFIDVTKSTVHRPESQFSQENEVRTVHSTLDRTGTTSRFLRLAFRINMEQLKLAQLDPLPPPEPLTAEDLAEIELGDSEAAADFAAMIDRFSGKQKTEDGSQRTETHHSRTDLSPLSPDPSPLAPPPPSDPDREAYLQRYPQHAAEYDHWKKIEDAEYAELEQQIAAGNFPGPTNVEEPEGEGDRDQGAVVRDQEPAFREQEAEVGSQKSETETDHSPVAPSASPSLVSLPLVPPRPAA